MKEDVFTVIVPRTKEQAADIDERLATIENANQKFAILRTAVNGLDLINTADVVISGGGTTLLNLLAGIDTPTSGSLTVDGIDIASLSRSQLAAWRANSVGYIFQLYNLVPVLTAYENVELPLLLLPMNRAERQRRVELALTAVDLINRANHYPRQLSGGQEQRVGIARAIVTDPTVVVAEWWRAGKREKERVTLLRSLRVEALHESTARLAGIALGLVRGATTIDAIVMASAATRGDIVYTSDATDLEALRRGVPAFARVGILHV